MLVLLFFIIFSFFIYNPVSANDYFFEDSFDDLSNWQLLNGDWDYWQIEANELRAYVDSRYKISTIVPSDHLWQDSQEYSVEFLFRPLDKNDKTFAVGMTDDANNFYDFHFFSDYLIVEDIRNGFSRHSTMIPYPLEIDRDYFVRIIFSKEIIELYIDEELVFFTDHNWREIEIGGKFALRTGTGAKYPSGIIFSQLKVRSLDQAGFSLLKQNDPIWADDIYDSAEQWTNYPIIKNWGCALSSAAMILNFYGHNYLPDGKDLNPGTLNQWLKEELDGYVGNGLVNWLAISRLSKILSIESGNPVLEFSYFSSDEEGLRIKLRKSLDMGQVQIAAIPGHFFLVDSYDQFTDRFMIKDPLYEYEFLADHSTGINSLRIFEPSYTDLSYLLFVIPKGINFSLSEGYSMVEENINYEQESLGDDYYLIYFQKLEDREINLLLEIDDQNKGFLKDLSIFSYQKDGSLSSFSAAGLSNTTNLLEIKVNYHKERESEFHSNFIEGSEEDSLQERLNLLKERVNQSFENMQLSFYLFYQLNQFIFSIESKGNDFNLLDKFLSFYNLDFETI